MLLVLTKVLFDYPFSNILSVLWTDYVLYLCFMSRLAWWYLSMKALLGGQASRVEGRASGTGKEKNWSFRIYSMLILCLGSFCSNLEIKCLATVERVISPGNE